MGLIESFPFGRRRFLTYQTPGADVRDLIKSLHPVQPSAPLIRLGAQGDGGYLVPDDLQGIAACYSPGVGSVADFERDCVRRGVPLVFLADGSCEKSPVLGAEFHFASVFVGADSRTGWTTMDSWVRDTLPSDNQEDLLLQIDIEGHEYAALLATSEALLRRFRIIVAEFHNLHQLWNQPFFNMARAVFGKILNSHVCVHIHPNNLSRTYKHGGLEIPRAMEFTFYARSRLGDTPPLRRDFPHPLDCDCSPAHPSVNLPSCWKG